MARLVPRRASRWIFTALLGGRLCAGVYALPQKKAPPDPPIVVLDSKSASLLVATQITPDYPAVAKVNFIQGQVRLQVIVSPQGRVEEVHAIEGHPFLAAAALKAIRRWAYRPLIRESIPTAFQTFVDMRFLLRPKKIDQIPNRPERDLTQRIRPPQIVHKPTDPAPAVSVRLRVLLNDTGQPIDSLLIGGRPAYLNVARKNIERWTFRPAYWGALCVPWYLDVDVPVESPPLPQGAADPSGQ